MTETAFADIDDNAPSIKRPRAFETIVYGGLAVGILDALDAMIFFGLYGKGVSPTRIFQRIASALRVRGDLIFSVRPAIEESHRSSAARRQ